MYINYINGLVAGYFLVAWAIVLNLLENNKVGVLFAIVSVGAVYVLESVRNSELSDQKVSHAESVLSPIMIITTVLSYVSWLLT